MPGRLQGKMVGSVGIWTLLLSMALVMAVLVACAAEEAAPAPTTKPAPAAPAATAVPAATAAPVTKATPWKGQARKLPAKPPKAPAAKPTSGPKDKVIMRMDWLFRPYHSPQFVALDKGWYAENGLDVELGEGRGSGNTAQLVATGSITFGFSVGDAVIKAVAAGAPITTVAGIFRKGGMGILSLKETPINKLEDLYDKAYGLIPGSAAALAFQTVFGMQGKDIDRVKMVSTSPRTKDALLIGKKIAATNCFDGSEVHRYKLDQKVDAQCLTFSELGLNVPGHGIVVRNSTLWEKPDMVRRFLDATIRGWEFARKNPAEAVKIIRKYHPEINEEYGLNWLPDILTYLDSEATKGKPIGWIDQGEWQNAINLLFDNKVIKKKPAVKDVFTNSFLPKR